MSFGLTNAPTTLDMMNRVFKDFLDTLFIVFIDVILIYFKTKEEHGAHLHQVLSRLRAHRLYAKFSKCEFWLQQVTFLVIISRSNQNQGNYRLASTYLGNRSEELLRLSWIL